METTKEMYDIKLIIYREFSWKQNPNIQQPDPMQHESQTMDTGHSPGLEQTR